jgi:hypothetical protein
MRARRLVGVCVTIGAAVAASASCAGGDRSCATVVTYAEPVLTIREVTGPDGVPVATVEMTRVRRDGRPGLADVRNGLRFEADWTPGLVTNSTNLHWNMRVSGGRILCDVPCGFGSLPANETVVRVASPSAAATWRGPVAYSTSRGCGPTIDGGVDIEILLRSPVSRPGGRTNWQLAARES